MDSLKKVYADRPIHLTFTNSEGIAPIATRYAWTYREGSDVAFELKQFLNYKLSFEEGFTFVPTQQQPERENSDMVLKPL